MHLNLSEDQREAVHDIFYDQVGKSIREDSEKQDRSQSMLSTSIELNISGGIMHVESLIIYDEKSEIDRTPINTVEVFAETAERRAKKIDEVIETLRPVLDDAQLQQYRSELELKSGGVLEGLDALSNQ